jgi:hypothetical protein
MNGMAGNCGRSLTGTGSVGLVHIFILAAFCLVQLSVIYAAKENSAATGKEKLN